MSDAIFQQLVEGIEGFKSRPQQKQMVDFIHQQLQHPTGQRIAVVEAPTGVGKTWAYLSGALETALLQKKLLVISTATVSLQQQLIYKDLPLFTQALEQPIKYLQIKGRRRYVCPSRLAQLASEPEQADLTLDIDQKYQQSLDRAVAKKLQQQFETQQWNGDRDTYPEKILPTVWSQMSTDSEGCAAKSCRYFLSCPYYALRREMTASQIVVVNHDVMLSDADLGGGLVLPNPEECIFVFDEAHNLPRKALDHAAKTLDFIQLYQTLETADKALKKLPRLLAYREADFAYIFSDCRRDIPALFEILQQLHSLLESDPLVMELRAGLVSEPRIFPNSPLVNALLIPMDNALQRANSLYKHFSMLAKWIREGLEKGQINNAAGESLLPQVGAVQNIIGYLLDFFALFMRADTVDMPPNVRWLDCVKEGKETVVVIHCGPMTAAGFLKKTLWQRAYGVVLTSATLRGMGRFQRFRIDCGLYDFNAAHFLAVESPFRYQEQATLHIPTMRYLPSDAHQYWQKEITDQLIKCIDLQAATLVIFTANQVMQAVYQQLPIALAKRVLMQGEGLSTKQILHKHIQRIEAGEGSILFGMDSFAEGVDLPGALCTHVIITKLPFPVFTRPIEQARQEWIIAKGGQPFTSLSLPAVSIKLIQACGRLLRRETDEGKITILDRRLITKGYGPKLLASLPNYHLVRD